MIDKSPRRAPFLHRIARRFYDRRVQYVRREIGFKQDLISALERAGPLG